MEIQKICFTEILLSHAFVKKAKELYYRQNYMELPQVNWNNPKT